MADGLGYMSCPLNFTISQSQNSSSALALRVTVSISHQAWCVFSKPYKLLVINLETGPTCTVIDIDVIFPKMLARHLHVTYLATQLVGAGHAGCLVSLIYIHCESSVIKSYFSIGYRTWFTL